MDPLIIGFTAGFLAATVFWFALEYAHGLHGVFYELV